MKAFQCERCNKLYPVDFLVSKRLIVEDKSSEFIIRIGRVKRSEPQMSKAFRIKEIDLCLNCLIELFEKKASALKRLRVP